MLGDSEHKDIIDRAIENFGLGRSRGGDSSRLCFEEAYRWVNHYFGVSDEEDTDRDYMSSLKGELERRLGPRPKSAQV